MNPVLREYYKYSPHSFADKKTLLPLQAADLVAWQWFTSAKRHRAGILEDRKDFIALVRDQDSYQYLTPPDLELIARAGDIFERSLR